MEETSNVPGHVIGPLPYLLYLLRGPILVATTLLLLITVSSDTMREAFRYAFIDSSYWYQLVVIAAALTLVCVAVRFSGEAIIELVAPEVYDHSRLRPLARAIPRALALLIALAVALPVFQIATDPVLLTDTTRLFRGETAMQVAGHFNIGPNEQLQVARGFLTAVALVYVLIGVLTALLGKGLHTPQFLTRDPPLLTRIGFAVFPLLVAAVFAGAAFGISQNGIADRAVERYASAFVGALPGNNATCGPLWHWVFAGSSKHECSNSVIATPSAAQQNASDRFDLHTHLYDEYISRIDTPDGPIVMAKVSPLYVIALLLSLFAACYTARLATAVFLDVLLPRLGAGSGLARFVRRWLPPTAAIGLALTVTGKLYYLYFSAASHYPATPGFVAHTSDPIALYGLEPAFAWAIMALFVVIGVAASLGSGSSFVADGAWRNSPSVGRRFAFAARRLAALPPAWQWFVRALVLLGLVIFLLFANLELVWIPQWLGPLGILLLWGSTVATVLFLLSFLGDMTRIPLLTIVLLAGFVFAGFALNNNHELRVVQSADSNASSALVPDPAPSMNLVEWMASRSDLDDYDRYPIFLLATEGGGIRAAYFTATVLAAIQDRCPAFARHTFVISGVSGGSVGASVFAALSADDPATQHRGAGCDLDGVAKRSANLGKARKALSADFLSPLLGALLFPDALQRFVPVPIRSFDRSIALEYAIEQSWFAAVGNHRMSQPVMTLYDSTREVPHLLLNTTEASTGALFPYTSGTIEALATPFRDQAQIDNGNVDCKGTPGDFDYLSSCLRIPPKQGIEQSSLQNVLDGSLRLSTAAVASARFPYVTPAAGGRLGGHFIDGGYFENSGTWLINGLLQKLVGQQTCLEDGAEQKSSCKATLATAKQYSSDPKLHDLIEKVRRAVFVVVVIKSDPCDRPALGAKCGDDQPIQDDDGWEELLSPPRGLMSTRDKRAVYSVNNLGAMVALIEQLKPRPGEPSQPDSGDSGKGCDYAVCTVTLEFVNQPRTEIPLTWLLSAGARFHIDQAVDGLVGASVRNGNPSTSRTFITAKGQDRVVGSYRRLFCALANTRNAPSGCAAAP